MTATSSPLLASLGSSPGSRELGEWQGQARGTRAEHWERRFAGLVGFVTITE
ncbi:hypothetical protein ACX80T_08805 [Arthrobacter sp. Sr33]